MSLRSVDQWEMRGKIATTEDKMDAFIVCVCVCMEGVMLWDPPDPSCKIQNERMEVLLWPIAEHLGNDSPVF